ncbi:BTB/POZ domain-containing protein [Forsythia ovata]|uniref:BTB/POZ domain-containing protein n=1 Tax=Forsythia ovata TaxID=205694 RepID=A0ABD1PZM0_9LAMI
MTTGEGGAAEGNASKEKPPVGSNSCLFSTGAFIDSSFTEGTLTDGSHESPAFYSTRLGGRFGDPSTADVILHLHLNNEPASDWSFTSDTLFGRQLVQVYLHSYALSRSKYFAVLLSDRWQQQNHTSSENSLKFHCKLVVPATTDSIDHYLTVLQLLYIDDLSASINSVSTAICLLPVALKLLFEDCIKRCVKFLEAVPWSENEENKILKLIPLLSDEESKELLARVSPAKKNSSEEMLHDLVFLVHNHPNDVFAKDLVDNLLKDLSSGELVRRVLDRGFERSLDVVKKSLKEYKSPELGRDDYMYDEIAMAQRPLLYQAMKNANNLLWLVERMIELRVADMAVKAWSEEASLTMDLQRMFFDDEWHYCAPSLPIFVFCCTSRIANAVATGHTLAARQARMKLVEHWLPVLIGWKESATMDTYCKSLCTELEETFLRIISTLSVSDAQELLQQCLGFAIQNVGDFPHLVTAFTTWFRRANRSPHPDDFGQ